VSPEEDGRDFFFAGGTLRPDTPSYVTRPADEELFSAIRAGHYCYVLTPRQMGKSSLMVRTARRLRQEGFRTSVIDLTAIGTGASEEQWYQGVVARLASQLGLRLDVANWWTTKMHLGPVQCFTDFLREVVLTEIQEPVVIFVDEIDTTLNLDFSDDFFAAVRSAYNERALDPAYNRLVFVFLGVATPSDLIKDPARTPFNVGQEIVLNEFRRRDAAVLEEGLDQIFPRQGSTIFNRIYDWTAGHPYLTQQLCLSVAADGEASWSDEEIDRLVGKMFLSDAARGETNIQFVSEKILNQSGRAGLLKLYRDVYRGQPVADNKRSLPQSQLKLSGLVKVENGQLAVRNRIYRQAFDEAWIRKHTLANWPRLLAITSVVTAVLSIVFLLYSGVWLPVQADNAIVDFSTSEIASFRAEAMLRLLKMRPLFGPDYSEQALTLFFSLNSWDEQAAICQVQFNNPADTVLLIRAIYGALADVGNSKDTTPLLETMLETLEQLPEDTTLQVEIGNWLAAREYVNQEELENALSSYNLAIAQNPRNPSTLFERARVQAALGNLNDALNDLDQVMAIALSQAQGTATPTAAAPLTPTLSPTITETLTATLSIELNATQGTPGSTPVIAPTRESGGGGIGESNTRSEVQFIRSSFVTRGQRINAVFELIRNHSALLQFWVAAPEGDYPNLTPRPTLTPTPTTTIQPVLPTPAEGEGGEDAVPEIVPDDVPLPIVGVTPEPTEVLPTEPTTPPSELLYEEHFDIIGEWGSGSDADVEGDVENGIFRLHVLAESGVFWSTGGENFNDGIYEVEATQIEGPLDNGYGMMFRVNNETDSFYLFEVSGDGFVWIGLCVDGCETEVTMLVGDGWFQSLAVNQGLNVTNHLRVEAVGGNFTFFVNDQQVGQAFDNRFANGDIGVLVETLGEGGVVVDFDNFRITLPAE
jgi:tetratricopeptide (TPR) repeat protein